MSADFIKKQLNQDHLLTAQRQQHQINYFIQSNVQEEITREYLEQWADRNYRGTDYFLTWVKMIFRTDNFMSFFKYLRHPVPSARLVNDNIKLQLKRVFTAEDSYSRYIIKGKEQPAPDELDTKCFDNEMFDALLYRYNDIIFTDLKEVNTPIRRLVCIDSVVAIESQRNKIERLAFSAKVEKDGKDIKGYAYADDKDYIFYDMEFNEIERVPHDLGMCPADYVSQEPFDNNEHCDVVRRSIFSYCRPELEEYVFLRTLQKMTEPNGAIPVVTRLVSKEVSAGANSKKGISDKEPMAFGTVGGQQAKVISGVTGSNSILQTGTIIDVPIMKDANGNVNMDVAKNFLTFHHIPVEQLTYLNDRIKEIEDTIISSCLGDYSEGNEMAMNEKQVGKSYVNKEDKLRYISNTLSAIRIKSDTKFLGLKHGIGSIEVDVFFGSDFFLQTQEELMSLFIKSPNPIESKNIILRLSRTRNLHNSSKSERERILYNILPFANNADFNTAITQNLLPEETKSLQTQFTYWISMFEAAYGDILTFWESIDAKESEKLLLINNLLNQMINEQIQRVAPNLQGSEAVV